MEDERAAVRHEILSTAAAATESSALNRIPLTALPILYRQRILWWRKRTRKQESRGGETVKCFSLTYYPEMVRQRESSSSLVHGRAGTTHDIIPAVSPALLVRIRYNMRALCVVNYPDTPADHWAHAHSSWQRTLWFTCTPCEIFSLQKLRLRRRLRGPSYMTYKLTITHSYQSLNQRKSYRQCGLPRH